MSDGKRIVSLRRHALAGLLLTALLGTWNGLAASYASPFHLIHAIDSTQYQLLARNRLHGHYEVGDAAHTVRSEGLHPAWRPGLVWIEEALARRLGSIGAGAAAASALGTTLLELLLIGLAVRAFGRAAGALVLLALLAPTPVGGCFLVMAVGEGPEPWSAAAVLAGLAGVREAVERRSGAWAVPAGAVAGLADWFRTGNLLLFGAPCAVYALAALRQRDWRRVALPIAASAGFLATAAVGARQVPSDVNKTVANLWARIVEYRGAKIPYGDGRPITLHLEGLKIVEGTTEDYYDYIVARSRNVSTVRFFADHASEILPIYLDGLRDVARHGFSGLRYVLGDGIFLCLVVQLLLSLAGRSVAPVDSLALASGALAYCVGPTALLRGDEPSHYLFVALPLLLLVAAPGLIHLWASLQAAVERRRPKLATQLDQARGILLILVLAPVACLSFVFYVGSLNLLRADHEQARQEHAALDALELEGKRVCCRNMSWFVDRNVQIVFLPYAEVAELERYARGHGMDGILVWQNERQPLLRVMPYSTMADFEERMREQFGPPRVSGAWHWYAVGRDALQ